MSSGHSRRSNDRLSVNAISSSAGPPSNRPCHNVFAGVVRRRRSRRSRSRQTGEVAQRVPRAPARRAPRRRRTAACRRRRRCRSARRRSERSSADATTCAHPGGVRRTTRLADDRDLGHPLPHHPPEVVLGREARRLVLGDRVHGVAAGHAHLHRAEVLEVARDGGLRRGDALARQQVEQLRLARDRLLARSAWR